MAKQTILIYLHSIEPPIASWVISDAQEIILQTTLRSDLSKLSTTNEQEITVVIPSTDILLTYAELPKLSQHRLQQAIPFAIEEQLIDDISQLHFAVGKYSSENLWPVAVVSLEKTNHWIEILKQLQIQPSTIIPAPLALPLIDNHWTVSFMDEFCFVRTNHYSGFTCERENIIAYLESKLSEKIQKPTEIDVYASSKIALAIKDNCQINYHKISEKQFIESLLETTKTLPSINLLQGPFRPKRKTIESKKLWRHAGLVTLAWISIGFFSHLFSVILLHHQTAKMENSIEAIYTRNFPDASSMIAPQDRMEQKLKKLTTQASNESFLVLLANVSKAFSASHGIRLQNLDYRDKQLTLEISANTFDNLDNLTHLLQQRGLSVKQQNAEVVAARVKATLQINTGNL